MATKQWSRVSAKRAAEIGAKVPLSPAGRELLKPEMTPGQFLLQLMAAKEHASAVAFLAHALPRREAVWWACLCTELSGSTTLPEGEQAALHAAVRWVVEPVEPNRRAAERPGRAAGVRGVCGDLALGAFYSGGSGNPPGKPIRAPAPTKTAQCVTRAMLRLVNLRYPRLREEAFRQFLAIGAGIADNRYRWA